MKAFLSIIGWVLAIPGLLTITGGILVMTGMFVMEDTPGGIELTAFAGVWIILAGFATLFATGIMWGLSELINIGDQCHDQLDMILARMDKQNVTTSPGPASFNK